LQPGFILTDSMKYLIVGLGNIGSKYEHTRHNAGFEVLDKYAEKNDLTFAASRLADVTTAKYRGRNLILIKPNTFINLSGKAVKYWMEKEKIPLERILVIVDDLALPIDTLRLRAKGSDAGHNGLKNIQQLLGNNRYPRLRFGIGNDFSKGKQIDFVLQRWNSDELPAIQKKIETSVEIIQSFVFAGVQNTMSKYNSMKF